MVVCAETHKVVMPKTTIASILFSFIVMASIYGGR
jgi:hypothetical protein